VNRREPASALTRREIVLLGVKAVAAGVAFTVIGCDGSDSQKATPEPTALVLPATFTDLASMRVVGKKYLELNPGETMQKLLSELKPARGFAALETEIRKQYATGDVVRVAGWVIALTEARIYAVVALRP